MIICARSPSSENLYRRPYLPQKGQPFFLPFFRNLRAGECNNLVLFSFIQANTSNNGIDSRLIWQVRIFHFFETHTQLSNSDTDSNKTHSLCLDDADDDGSGRFAVELLIS